MAMKQIKGFAPDLPPTTAEVMADCVNIIPTADGNSSAPTPQPATGVAALAAPCRGAVSALKTDSTRRVLAGTQTRLYELIGGAWTDVSRALFYTGSADNRWSFAQLGDATIAANDNQVLQASTAGAFADIATAPKAKVVAAAAGFVVAFNTQDGTYGDQGDRWWCSALFDHTSWTPAVATQATTGRLVAGGGEILAALPIGQQLVAYKERGLYLGSYVGAPVVWQWDQIPGEIGCVGPEAVCDIGGAHVFVGPDNIWLFDGTRPQPIAVDQVRQWFFENSSPQYRYRTIVQHERQNSRAWFFFPGPASSTGEPDRALVWHTVTKQWGFALIGIQAALTYSQPGLTFDGLGAVGGGTFDTMPGISFDSQFWLAGARSLAVFSPASQLATLTGPAAASRFTTNDLGDDWRATKITSARIRFVMTPSSASVSGFTLANTGSTAVMGGSGTLADGKFDIRQSARWHRLLFTMTGDASFNGLDVDMKVGGRR